MKYKIAIPYTAYGDDYTWVEADNEEQALEIVQDTEPSEFTNPCEPFEAKWSFEDAYVVEVEGEE